ncbi:MAG: NAD(P)-dependent oxidoreductase, partial [bacterium]|nr:NAD(P)-dependent oxidoreductase [bacterium]
IGSHLVDLLLEEGISVDKLRLLIPLRESLSNLPKEKFDIVRGDIRDKSVVKKSMEDVETIYHLAARIDFDGKNYSEYKDINVDGTQNLLDECKGKSIQKFVFFSSIGVFGLPAGIGDIINWDEAHSKTYTNFYGESKWEGEKMVMEAHNKWGIPYVIIRPASVYGPREKGPTLALYKAIKNHQFIMIGNGLNKMHYVYVGDLVKAARLAELSNKKTGDYIIGGEKPTTLREIVNDIAESIDEKVPNFHIPKNLALVLSYGLDFAGRLVGISSPLFPSRVKTMTTSYYYNIKKAKKEIGYKPEVSFKEGAKITGKWYLDHNYV